MVFIPRWERYKDKKPSGSVELNVGHELADGIAVAYAFNDDIDLVNELNGQLSGGAYIENGVLHSNFGRMEIPVNRNFSNLSFVARYRAPSPPGNGSPVNIIGANNQSFIANYMHTVSAYIGVFTTVNSGWAIADFNIQGITQATIAGVINSTTTKAFKNGVIQNSYNTGFSAGIISAIKLACNESSTTNYSGDMQFDFVYVFDKALTDEQIADLSNAPYQIIKPRRKWFYFADAAGIQLLINNLSHNNTLDSIALTQQNILSIDNSSQSASIDNLALNVGGTLTINNISQSNAVDNIALIQANQLQINGLLNNVTIDNIAIDFSVFLDVSNTNQSVSLENIVLTQAGQYTLIVSDLLHDMLLDNINLIDGTIELQTNIGTVFMLQSKHNIFIKGDKTPVFVMRG